MPDDVVVIPPVVVLVVVFEPVVVVSPPVVDVVTPVSPPPHPAYAATATPRHINAICKPRSRILGLLLQALPARRMQRAR
jgi:hypothetical protein